MTDPVVERVIIGPGDQERTAVITVSIPAGGELPMDPTFRFEGWLMTLKSGKYRHRRGTRVRLECERPATLVIEGDDS